MDQATKAAAFKALHERKKLFVIPNPWDGGSAKLLASMGFEALTTTSAGLAFVLGKPDGGGHPRGVALERQADHRQRRPAGRGRSRERLRPPAGGCGGDDPAGRGGRSRRRVDRRLRPATKPTPIYDFGLAVERVAAAAEAAHALPFPFMFVARAENFLHGVSDLDDTIRRLQAYEKAGADVLFAPGLPTSTRSAPVCASVSKPVNVVIGAPGYTLAQLEEAGVRRVSVGGGFCRVALTRREARRRRDPRHRHVRVCAGRSQHGSAERGDGALGLMR